MCSQKEVISMVEPSEIEKAHNKQLVVSSWLASLNQDGSPSMSEICGILHIVTEVGEVLNALINDEEIMLKSVAPQ